MKKFKIKIILSLSILLMLNICTMAMGAPLPAFPGAEGFGAYTVGGRGGTVIKVTNLNDSGPGSLRAAVEASMPRIVVFEVSGNINLEKDLNIFNPYLTIAGQTSPGGILITGRKTLINTQHVIVQHMRFRVGSHRIADGADAGTLDSLNIWGDGWGGNAGDHVIIDHCSVSWGIDENMSITGGVTNCTVQWSIFSEGLTGYVGPGNGHNGGSYLHSDMKDHSKGLMVSGKPSNDPFPNTVSLHHNYIAHNTGRSPLIYTPSNVSTTVDAVNNVIYDWKGGLGPQGEGTPHINWVYNYAKQGPNSNSYSFEVTHDVEDSGNPQQLLYVFGNIGSTRLSQAEPHWNVGKYYFDEKITTDWQQSTPWSVPAVTTTIMSYDYAKEVLTTVGATAPIRDSVDAKVIADFSTGTGSFRNNVDYPDDFPVFLTPAPPTDTDDDGMPDAWENTYGLNPNVNDSSMDKDGDGYTNIEEYLHELSENSFTVTNKPTIQDIKMTDSN